MWLDFGGAGEAVFGLVWPRLAGAINREELASSAHQCWYSRSIVQIVHLIFEFQASQTSQSKTS
jgi:hypothetical protein